LKSAGIPVVLLDSDFVTPPSRSEYDLVGVDNTGIGYMLAKHVIDAGAKAAIPEIALPAALVPTCRRAGAYRPLANGART